MNSDIKKAWLDALRSGKYQQGNNQLRKGEYFCCLGVLCDIHNKMTGEGQWTVREDPDRYYYQPSYPDSWSCSEVLPREIVQWAGLDNGNPSVGDYGCGNRTYGSIAELNDYGYTFKSLADIIEEKL